MGNDRVLSVDNGRVITSLVEHTHVNAENIGKINSTSHSSFIRADDHQMIVIDHKVRYGIYQCF